MNTDESSEKEHPCSDSARPPGASYPLESFFTVCVLTLVFVILADWLFFGQPLGWTIGAYGMLLMGALLIVEGPPNRLPVQVMAVGLSALFLGCLEEPGRLLLGLGVFGLISLALVLREGWSNNAMIWAARGVAYTLRGWFSLWSSIEACRESRWGADTLRGRLNLWTDSEAYRESSRASQEPGGLSRVLRGWLLPVTLGLLFLTLFAVANPIIASWLSSAWETFTSPFRHLPTFTRILFWTAVGLQVWALLDFRSGVADAKPDVVEDGLPRDLAGFLSPATILRSLVIFNVIFGVQTVLDLFYLWGGTTLPESMTYAQYAHRGAYPLVVAALLAAAFVLETFQPGRPADDMRWSRRLVYAWLVQNVFLVVSVGWRLRLYVNAYTLTRWRVAAGIWMLLIACGLLWILVRIATRRSNQWLINVNALTAVAVVFVCAFVNIDGSIASFNVRHCEEIRGKGHPPIDVEYLSGLGYDALPALIWLAGQMGDHPRATEWREVIRDLEGRLKEDLINWRGWTYRRSRIAEAIRRKESDAGIRSSRWPTNVVRRTKGSLR